MNSRRAPIPLLLVSALALIAGSQAHADPISVDFSSYRLETIGSNTIGLTNGSDAGTPRTLFVSRIAPNPGTTATATLAGAPTSAPFYEASSNQWIRTVINPTVADLGPLTVTFANGADTSTYVGRDLSRLSMIKLATNLSVDATIDPFGPTINWALPSGNGDIDNVQLVFYSNATNLEIGTRQTLGATATSYDLYGPGTGGALPFGFDLTIEVRLVDFFDDSLPLSAENTQRDSRAYINYTTPLAPVPEPSTYALMVLGLAALTRIAKGRKSKA